MNEIILSTTDIQKYMGVDATFKPENLMGPAKMKAATEIKDIISPAVYDAAVAYINRDPDDDPDPGDLDAAVLEERMKKPH